MAFKLSKQEKKSRQELIEKLEKTKTALEDSVSVFNDELEKIRDPLRQIYQEYIDAVAEAGQWVEQLAEEKRGEYDDKSERWQEGDNGQAADSWIQELEAAVFDEPDLDLPEDVSVEAFEDFVETLENLPEEP